MGIHLTDSIFRRQRYSSVVDNDNANSNNNNDDDGKVRANEGEGEECCEWFGTGGGDITVLEVGGQRASGEFSFSSSRARWEPTRFAAGDQCGVRMAVC